MRNYNELIVGELRMNVTSYMFCKKYKYKIIMSLNKQRFIKQSFFRNITYCCH